MDPCASERRQYADAVAGWISLYAADAVFLLGHSLGEVIGTCHSASAFPSWCASSSTSKEHIGRGLHGASCRVAGHTLEDFLAYGYECSARAYRRGMHER